MSSTSHFSARVASRQHHLLAFAFEQVGHLGDGRGLAAAVDADHQHDVRLVGRVDRQRRRHRLQDLGDVVGERRAHLLVGDLAAEALLAKLLDQPRRHVDAEVGLDQRILELVQGRLVELLLGEEAGDAFGDALGAFRKTRAQPRQPGALLLAHSSPRYDSEIPPVIMT
jgi:hypothetical protein